jgi:hypothetical protein
MAIVKIDGHSDILVIYRTPVSQTYCLSFSGFRSCTSREVGCRSEKEGEEL